MPASLLTPLTYATVALAWSGGWIFGKLGVTAVPPLEFVAVRFVLASALLLLVARVTRTSLRDIPLGGATLAAFFGFFGYNSLAFVGLTMAPASDAALIGPPSIPVLTAIGATIVGERMTRAKAGGLALASLGAAIVIAAGQTGGTMDTRRLVGDLMLLGAAVCWATYTIVGSVVLRGRSPLAVVALATPIGTAMLLPLGFLEHGYADVPTWGATAWLAVAYLTVVVSVVSFVLYFYAVRRFGAGLAAMVSYLVPIGTLALAVVVLGERPAPLQLVGGAIVLAGVRLATARRRVEPLEGSVAA